MWRGGGGGGGGAPLAALAAEKTAVVKAAAGSDGGAGGGGVNEALAVAATVTTMSVMETAEKEVAVKKVSWLKSGMPNARREEGGIIGQRPLSEVAARSHPWAHPRKLRTGTDEDVSRVLLALPR